MESIRDDFERSLPLPRTRRNDAPQHDFTAPNTETGSSGSSETLNNNDNVEKTTPSRQPRSVITTRPRGESRSVSMPPASLTLYRLGPNAIPTRPAAQHQGSINSRSEVRHLTCWYWLHKGRCDKEDENCAYAHHDTGRYAERPRQVVPGEPAQAGRNLERTLSSMTSMRRFANPHRSSSSLSALNRTRSRASSPLASAPARQTSFDLNTPASTPSPRTESPLLENAQLRQWVEDANHEKRVIMHQLERVQEEKQVLLEALREQINQTSTVVQERDTLRTVVAELQYHNRSGIQQNPFGAIGTGRYQN